ncbi:tyrosine-type recombinase/integrase [Planctomicrobium sp.]|nr:tyrosine-type recombinase/integrase [Planctomicrobium sp.]MDB4731514.1 tyrosine-type recombinase/integrase [bacterium]MDB4743593.1 tyrosine-type recombinase/integrase [Planctomicrobium sp.]
MAKKRVPKYSHHKPSGQARVRIEGKDVYLGAYGSLESHQRYSELLGEWSRSNSHPVKDVKVRELAQLYIEHCKIYYRKNGEVTGEVANIKSAIRYLNQKFRNVQSKEIDTLKLEAVREHMIQADLARKTINCHISRIKSMFKWAANKKLIDKMVYLELTTLEGLKEGRSMARETDAVVPVPEAYVDAVEQFVTSPIWNMIQLQMCTGMRPGEVLQIRACDLVTSGEVWEYRPQSHKTQHKKKLRIVHLGKHAQELIEPYLTTDLQAYLFSPLKGRAEYTSKNYCDDAKAFVRNDRRRYSSQGYYIAIKRACESADVPHWSPNRLRHNFATNVRREHGIEAARVLLGHSSAVTSEIYAEVDIESARAVIAKIG